MVFNLEYYKYNIIEKMYIFVGFNIYMVCIYDEKLKRNINNLENEE